MATHDLAVRLSTVDSWARAHHGLITLEASGWSRSAWYRAVDAGTLVQIHPYVARLPGNPDTPELRITAAVLAVGNGALASHRSSVRLWGVHRPGTDPVDLVVPGCRVDRALDGVIIHRTNATGRLRPQRRHGIACTNMLRALVDLGAVDPSGVGDAVGHALAMKLVDLSALESALTEFARSGRSGVAALRAAIDEWSIDSRPSDSTLESAMNRLIDRYRLPPVHFHPIIDGWEVDFRVVGTPVILECDGWVWHGLDRANFERDRVRDAELIAAGWIVVRFSYRAIMSTPGKVAARIGAATARWSATTSPDAV